MENLVKTQTIKSLTEKEHLYRSMLKIMTHEIMWYRKMEVKHLMKQLHDKLKSITYNNDQRTHGSWVNEFNNVSKGLKLTKQWHHSKSLQKCWRQFIIELCPTDYLARLTRIYKNCLLALKDTLDDEWIIALRDSKWQGYLEVLLDLKNSGIRFRLKSHIPDFIARSAVAMYTLICIIIAKYEPVIKLLEQSNFWSVQLTWEVLKVVYGVWPTVLRHYWRPETYLNYKWIVSVDGLGMITLYEGFSGIFAHPNLQMFKNSTNFKNALLPWQDILANSRQDKIPEPNVFKWKQLDKIRWNENEDPNHHTCKINTLPQIVHTVLLNKHHSTLKSMYGEATFENKVGFNTTILHNTTFDSSIGALVNSLHKTSIETSEEKTAAIKKTLNTLEKYSLIMYENPKIPGITSYSREYVDNSMLPLFLYFFLLTFLQKQNNVQIQI